MPITDQPIPEYEFTDLPIITGAKSLELLRQVVADKGADHMVELCQYVLDDVPQCLVGCALADYGYTPDDLEHFEGTGAGCLWVLDGEAQKIMEVAQNIQDGSGGWGDTPSFPGTDEPNRTWGLALAEAERCARLEFGLEV